MSAALTVQPRHLSLPDACLVTPSQLSIPRSISKEDFLAVAAKLKALGQAEDFWLADAASFAKKWDDGLQLMAETVGRTKYHLVRVAQIAERFTPAKRFSYTVAHLRALMPFPDEFLDSFLHSAANLNLSVKALRARAETEFGSNPYKPKNPTKRSIPLRASLVAQLSERAPRKVSALVERICESWLEQRPEAPNQPVGSSESDVPAPAATQPCPPNTETPKPESQTETGRSGPKEYLDAEDGIHRLTDRPTYDQRRAAQLENGSEPIKKKLRKPKPHALRLQWVLCGRILDAGNGPAMARVRSQRPDCFRTLEDAQAAEEKYFQEKGYRNEIVECLAPCGAFHVRHSYSGDVAAQKKSAQAISA